MSLEERVAKLEKRNAYLSNALASVEQRLTDLTDEVGHVLEARECESDSDDGNDDASESDEGRVSDDDEGRLSDDTKSDGTSSSFYDDLEGGIPPYDGSSSSEESPSRPIHAAKLIESHYKPVPTKLPSVTSTSTASTSAHLKKTRGAKTPAPVSAPTKQFKQPAKVAAGAASKKRKTEK